MKIMEWHTFRYNFHFITFKNPLIAKSLNNYQLYKSIPNTPLFPDRFRSDGNTWYQGLWVLSHYWIYNFDLKICGYCKSEKKKDFYKTLWKWIHLIPVTSFQEAYTSIHRIYWHTKIQAHLPLALPQNCKDIKLNHLHHCKLNSAHTFAQRKQQRNRIDLIHSRNAPWNSLIFRCY